MDRNQMRSKKSLAREAAENNLIVAERVIKNMGLNHDEYYSLAVISLYEFTQRFFERYNEMPHLSEFRTKAYRAIKIDLQRQIQKDIEYKELEDCITDLSNDDLKYFYKSPDMRCNIEDTVTDKILLRDLISSSTQNIIEEEVMKYLEEGYAFDDDEMVYLFGKGTCRRIFDKITDRACNKYRIMKLREGYNDVEKLYVLRIDHPLFDEPKRYVAKASRLEKAMEHGIELAFRSSRLYKSGFKVISSEEMIIFSNKTKLE